MHLPVQVSITPNKYTHISDKPYEVKGFKHLYREVINDVGELVQIDYRDCKFVIAPAEQLV